MSVVVLYSLPPHFDPSPLQRTPVESAVTRLLVAIKQLLEALTQWSKLEITESQVSDVYVRLGNDFNMAVAAFGQYNIDMRYNHPCIYYLSYSFISLQRATQCSR